MEFKVDDSLIPRRQNDRHLDFDRYWIMEVFFFVEDLSVGFEDVAGPVGAFWPDLDGVIVAKTDVIIVLMNAVIDFRRLLALGPSLIEHINVLLHHLFGHVLEVIGANREGHACSLGQEEI